MPEKRNDGGPAFPQFDVVAGDRDGHGDAIEAYTVSSGGMSLRDWFAGQCIEQCLRNCLVDDGSWDANNVAYHAYMIADAMLAARSK